MLLLRLGKVIGAGSPLLIPGAIAGVINHSTRKATLTLLGVEGIHIAAYSLNLFNSDSPYGERYFLEGFAFLALASGLGAAHMLSALSRTVRISVIAVTIGVSLVTFTILARRHLEIRKPYVRFNEALARLSWRVDAVFLKGTAQLIPIHEYVKPGFENTRLLVMRAPNPDCQAVIAAALNRRHWIYVVFDGTSLHEITSSVPGVGARASCRVN